MRLWHKDLISKLSNKHILGQHRECAALRGNGWGRKHSTVDYVFTHPYSMLYNYHKKIMQEMINRNYKVDPNWTIISYRGKKLNHDYSSFVFDNIVFIDYPEHNDEYYKECVENLKRKGFEI